MNPCTCQYSASLGAQQGSAYERGLKTLTLSDTALFLPHVVPFINFNEEQEKVFYEDPDTLGLLLARMWGALPNNLLDTIRERILRRGVASASPQDADTADELAIALEKVNPSHPAVLKWKAQVQARAVTPGQNALDRVRDQLGDRTPSSNSRPPRQLVEYAAIVDTLRNTSIEEAAQDLASISDSRGAAALRSAAEFSRTELGLKDLRIIADFPIALCAVGYTRITRDPARSILKPFEAADSSGRVPLYVVNSETEGIYFQLDPTRVIAWLARNRWCEVRTPEAEEGAWAWLYSHIPGLFASRWEPEFGEPLAVAIRTLIHTMSHVLLRHVEWSGFNQNSVGEYLLPGALAGVLYANRYAETKIGGLTTLFEHQLGIWLEDSSQSGRNCVYDPFCTDEGGTCVGCLHREYNCPLFNRELSRAVLYGGPTPPTELGGNLGVSVVEVGFWQGLKANQGPHF